MSNVRRICVLTTGRQDWGILRSTSALLRDSKDFDLRVVAAGMACSTKHGSTDQAILAEGFTIAERLAWEPGIDAVYTEAGTAIRAIGEALDRQKPDALVLLGDRFETISAAVAATTLKIPIVHLHGGEQTEGAFDDAFRHAITKMAHLHLVSHEDHRRRVVEMGEDPASVHVVGAPGLDNLHRADLPSRADLEQSLGITLAPPVVLVTVHPTTMSNEPMAEVECAVAAMQQVEATYVITLPNSDPGNAPIRDALVAFAQGPRRVAVDALGERRYWGMMRVSDAMLGNTSSALIEAPALGLPAVNVGDRQKGRARGANVIDVGTDADAVTRALRDALDPAFRARAVAAGSLFGDGHSAPRVVDILSRWRPVLAKKHHPQSGNRT
jgi:UDP-hydrolysing UDP-N-acetyl-D-glucosamine 2-epimerase